MAEVPTNPKKIKAVVGGKTKTIVIVKNWIHQGFTYLDRTEKFYRVIWELIPFGLCVLGLSYTSVPLWMVILVSFVVSHTLNWAFNDNIWTCIQFTFPWAMNPGNEKTLAYLEDMERRFSKYECVTGVMVYGSLSRGVWHEKSDLDTRIMRKPGVWNGFKCYILVHLERLRAFYYKQPLDMYMADSVKFLDLMRDDEFPIFLKANDIRLVERYKTIELADFSKVKHLNDLSKESPERLRILYGNKYDI